MHGFRKDKNPIVNAVKGVGSAISSGLEAMAEAAREEEARREQARQTEIELRDMVEHYIKEYERETGLKFRLKTDENSSAPTLPWDPDNKGHLLMCPPDCRISHCLTCGMENYGFLYCSKHRP